MVDCYSKMTKLTRKSFDQLTKIIEAFNQQPTNQQQNSTNNPSFEIENDFFEIELTPGVYEFVDMNRTIIQNLSDSNFEFEKEEDPKSMKSVIIISNHTHFNLELNKILGFMNARNSEGTHKSEKPVTRTSIDNM